MRWLLAKVPLYSFRIEAGLQKDQVMIRGLRLSALPKGRREARSAGDWAQWPMASDLINHAYVMKPPLKTPEKWSSESFQIGEHIEVGESGTARWAWKLCVPPYVHFFHLAVLESYPFLNLPVLVSKMFSWVLWAIPANQEESWESLDL